MIVPCPQCQTRFKVPDGKVTARGLKVRCSRCNHTFRVYPEAASERAAEHAPAAPRPSGPDPFLAFGPEGASDLEKTPARGTEVSALLAQMGPLPAVEDFDVDISAVEPSRTEPAWSVPAAPGRAAMGAGPAALAFQSQAAPGEAPSDGLFEEETARVPIPVWPLPPATGPEEAAAEKVPAEEVPDTSSGEAWSGGEPSDPSARPPLPVRPLPLAPVEPGPDAPAPGSGPRRGQDVAALAGFTPAWGVAAPVRALSVDGTLSSHVASLSPAAEPESLAQAPQFGGAGTVLDDLPTLEPVGPASNDPVELDPGNAARVWTGAEPLGDGGLQLELEPDLASLELDRGLSPEPAHASPPELDWAVASPGGPRSAPAAPPSPLDWDDPFADPPPAHGQATRRIPPTPAEPEHSTASPRGPSAGSSVVLDEAPPLTAEQPDHAFFSMPEARPPPGAEAPDALLPDVPEAQEPLTAAAVSSPGTPTPIGAISKPPTRTRLGLQDRETPGTARRVSAAILNVSLAALLLLVVVGLASSWASAGRVDGSAFSPRRLLQALRPSRGVTPVEVTPGTYQTRSGRSLLYVRGRVLNRGAPAGRIRVRAEVWDGTQAVKTGETLAGAIATPEELWRAATTADIEALRARLLAAATQVADGQQADFLVLLDEAPPDLSGLRLRVNASIER